MLGKAIGKWMLLFATLVSVGCAVLAEDARPSGKVQETPVHEREFWRAIAKERVRGSRRRGRFSLGA